VVALARQYYVSSIFDVVISNKDMNMKGESGRNIKRMEEGRRLKVALNCGSTWLNGSDL
jgi:hypothetical protein